MDTPTYIGNFRYDPISDSLIDVRKVEVTPELIDPRWRRQIEQDLRKEFGPALSEEILRKAVSVVLSPDEELPEAEYEYLSGLPQTPAKRLMLEDLM